MMTALLAFGITALMGFWLIPLLRKVKYGQTILDIGPVWHKNKQGTPTMGGFLFMPVCWFRLPSDIWSI